VNSDGGTRPRSRLTGSRRKIADVGQHLRDAELRCPVGILHTTVFRLDAK
jgi:hypothetical protein